MTLIIGVRCKDGCLVVADYRNRIESHGQITCEDNFEKVVKHKDYLLYNHGYNRIEDDDWKLRWPDLTPDDTNSVYKQILNKMKFKSVKSASYVFISKDMLYEIVIKVGEGVKLTDYSPDDRIVSVSGDRYVTNLKLLENLRKRKCKGVYNSLRKTSRQAYLHMKFLSGNEFSEKHKIYRLMN